MQFYSVKRWISTCWKWLAQKAFGCIGDEVKHLLSQFAPVRWWLWRSIQLRYHVMVVGVKEFGHVQCDGALNATCHCKILIVSTQVLFTITLRGDIHGRSFRAVQALYKLPLSPKPGLLLACKVLYIPYNSFRKQHLGRTNIRTWFYIPGNALVQVQGKR